MTPPWQAVAAVALAIVGLPLVVYAATRVRAGQVGRHRTLMLGCVAVEVLTFASFGLIEEPSPRRAALVALPIFKIHLAFAISALAGQGWQLVSRAVPRLRPAHRHTGPYVVLVWCLALLTGIYNYAFLYVMGPR